MRHVFSLKTRRTRTWLVGVLLLTALTAGIGLKVHHSRKAMPGDEGKASNQMSLFGAVAHAKASPVAQAYTALDLQKGCTQLISQRLYQLAISSCEKFTLQSNLAPRAHAMLAALYTTRLTYDMPNSVRHAVRASDLGDARGKFLLAAHMLAGHYRPFDPKALTRLLNDARNGGIAGAGLYLQALSQSQACRAKAQLKPLGLPVFCMFRAELLEALHRRGVRLKEQDAEHWRDSFATGDVLVSAREAELEFDVDPREEIHRVSRLSYQIVDEEAETRWSDLQESLSRKYGKPQQVISERELVWKMNDGTVVRLLQEDHWAMRLSYEMPSRVSDRQAHLELVDKTSRQDRVLAEAQSL